jgi:hypothetical protein
MSCLSVQKIRSKSDFSTLKKPEGVSDSVWRELKEGVSVEAMNFFLCHSSQILKIGILLGLKNE